MTTQTKVVAIAKLTSPRMFIHGRPVIMPYGNVYSHNRHCTQCERPNDGIQPVCYGCGATLMHR